MVGAKIELCSCSCQWHSRSCSIAHISSSSFLSAVSFSLPRYLFFVLLSSPSLHLSANLLSFVHTLADMVRPRWTKRVDMVRELIVGLGRLESVKREGVFRLLSCFIRMVVALFYSSGPFSLPWSKLCFIHPVFSTYILLPLLIPPLPPPFVRSVFPPFFVRMVFFPHIPPLLCSLLLVTLNLMTCLGPIHGYLSLTSTRLLIYISRLHPKSFPSYASSLPPP
ncbi:hypothetical protein BDQ17DRAFT_270399 [Cyathus striatus]|nr:hypothetical protein BDQ17DRAFT_270399 [Cyathus striatus]